MTRIAIVTEIPAPFRIPLFNALASTDGVELSVQFLAASDPRRSYPVYADEFHFPWEVLPGHDVLARGRWVVLNRGVGRALSRADAEVVVLGGWNQPAFWSAQRWAGRNGRKTAAWVESTARDARSNAPVLERAKRRFLRRCDAFIVPGRASAEYIASFGAEGQIAVAPNAVDGAIFGERVAAARERRRELREELGIERDCILYVGRLVPEKGVDLLVGALAENPSCELIVAGEGPERARLAALATDVAPGRIRFLGYVARDDIPPWYAAADVFALPSRSEQWGMVLNEAVTAGLPLVASDAAGGAHDLVDDGNNGFVVPAGDGAALAGALTRLLRDTALRERGAARSLEIARGFTPAAWAGAVAALASDLSGSPPQGGKLSSST